MRDHSVFLNTDWGFGVHGSLLVSVLGCQISFSFPKIFDILKQSNIGSAPVGLTKTELYLVISEHP